MSAIGEELLRDVRSHLDEGRQRLHKCLGMLTAEQLWHRPNANTVSVGNLVLHLCGNVGQWINATLGGEADGRQRDLEFDERGQIPSAELIARLDRTMDRALKVIAELTDEQLLRTYAVQVYQPTGIGILVHVTEHFSYHVGQVTLHTKLLLNVDTGYYAGKDLNLRPGEEAKP